MNEAELLFSRVLDCDRVSLYTDKKLILNKDKSRLVSAILKRRIAGVPIQYILGKAEFMGLDFQVTPDVLIPRPETGILVETALQYVTTRNPQLTNILDLGTGSGCIAVSLAKFIEGAKITAVDISNEALELAKENAALHNVDISFIQSDLFAGLPLSAARFDAIVANPPYIASGDIAGLQPEIRYEPVLALDGGKDGLDFYGKIIKGSPPYLKEGGFLIIEIGFNQEKAVKNIFQSFGGYEIIKVIKDYNNIDRVVVARKIAKARAVNHG